MERKNYLEKYSIWFLVIIYSVGVAGHLYKKTLPLMLALTPFTLLLVAVFIIFFAVKNNKSVAAWFLISYTLTFFIEVAGVKTKLIFGNYTYGNVLGVQLFGVPLIIGINWVIVTLGSISVAERFINNKLVVVIIAGAVSTLFDFLLEPVAVKLGYWNWFNNTIPMQNYLAWFLIACVIASLFLVMKLKVNKSLAEKYLYIQSGFFIILNYFL
ncbi:MAG: hypothetical protein FD143_2819 [Ignavibacteria bacterium]|nr:MAG: hypothetical protein FD143_2819 [Ignavibacteria bacterium]KAF0155688.1 MAG: hypothetical protein FD188_3107 [Ignavibacteria bacterium]